MADNFSTTVGDGTGPDFASDDVGSVQYPRGKVSLGADGSAADALGGAGAVAAGVQRVTLASDDPAVVDLAAIEVLQTTIAGDTTSIDGKITACNTGAVVVSSGAITETNSGTIAGDTTSIEGKITACNTGATVLTNTSILGPGDPVVDSYTQVVLSEDAGSDNEIIAAPGADKQIWIYGAIFSCDTAATSVNFQDEDDTSVSGVMLFAQYGGMAVAPSGNFSQPLWKVPTNKALEVDLLTGDIDGTLTYGIIDVS